MNRMITFLLLMVPVLSCSDTAGTGSNEYLGPIGSLETVYTKQDGTVRLVAYNVGAFSKEMTDSSPVIASMMKEIKADAMVLNELDKDNDRHNYDQLAKFAEYMDWNCYFGKAMDYRNGEYGNGAAWSKELKVLDKFVIALPKDTGSEDRSCVVIEFEDFVYAGTHLEVKTANDRILGVKIISAELKERYGSGTKPVFLGGDMNSVPDSDVVAEILKDWKRLTPTQATCPAISPKNCADYIFALRDVGTYKVTYSAVCTKFYAGSVTVTSDHLPVLVDILLD